jgi:DNA ligase-1
MKLSEILEEIRETAGTNDKKEVLQSQNDNDLLKKVLKYGLDPFTPFNIVKVPKVKNRQESPYEEKVWGQFFEAADACATRKVTGNDAIETMHHVFSTAPASDEKWMRKILKKHLAIGASTKTVNKVFPGLIPTFEVALAQKFEEKRIAGKDKVAVEPKLDGIRCFAIVEDGESALYARSGKLISNFDSTIGTELAELPDGCYDGEIMGEDFIALMRQAYRKANVVTEGTYLSLFDYIPLTEWKSRETELPCQTRYNTLISFVNITPRKYLKVVPRHIVAADYTEIKSLHDEFVNDGYEGAMIKDLSAPYKFGRGPEVMKLKAFHDVDLKIEKLLEGTGRHTDKLGSVVVNYKGVEVQVGSGFSDDLRDKVWSDPTSFVGRMIEVRYQEVTPDGSLRFPTFVCFRNDR